ncbi:thermonuclease family protein [Pelobacter propionicus]|uniref:Nuclease (SNase domain protein) n=1 Tax=Pelobacter propionicus (strain DSM 2379 / NBRC 103807 / OttBd1) TaxID=338966 RepID=A0R836_PELPD|nr:thermonuclease family protein [Pelobacter propionicus]ABL01255.1 nuclease (SNase domain protein) [Pelobacter propionicus DSM 2379]
MIRHLVKNIIVFALTLSCALPALAKEPLRIIEGAVSKVSDGDTIQVTDRSGNKVKVRFYGIDCPETEKGNKRTGKISKPGQPYGEEALQALQQKIERQNVRLEVMAVDRYHRVVSIVMFGNRNINKEMVADGWAWAYRQYLDRPYASEYIQAEAQARKAKKGLWQQNNPQPPWEFRKLLKKSRRDQN